MFLGDGPSPLETLTRLAVIGNHKRGSYVTYKANGTGFSGHVMSFKVFKG